MLAALCPCVHPFCGVPVPSVYVHACAFLSHVACHVFVPCAPRKATATCATHTNTLQVQHTATISHTHAHTHALVPPRPQVSGANVTALTRGIFRDPKNRLVMSYMDVVEKLRPAFVMVENVAGAWAPCHFAPVPPLCASHFAPVLEISLTSSLRGPDPHESISITEGCVHLTVCRQACRLHTSSLHTSSLQASPLLAPCLLQGR